MKNVKKPLIFMASLILCAGITLFGCDDNKSDDPEIPEIPVEQRAQAITNFAFLKEDTGLAENIYGVINQSAKTITFTTQKWINNIEKLPAVFTLDDTGRPYVNGISQISGTTQNDFRKEVVYWLNDNVEYRVIFVSPQASGLPVIRIDTLNSAPIANRETWVTMTFSLSDPDNPLNDIPPISDQQIRGRGNSSWSDTPGAKNPYRIRFRNNQQQTPFGLAAARNWVILKDGSDINTSFGFELGKRLGLQYTCTYHHVQVYLNGNYRGTYLFTEHRQADPAMQGVPGRPKVDLNEGWFVQIDRYFDEEPRFRTTNYNLPVMISSPELSPENMTNPGYNFVRNDWNEVAALMEADSFPENGYRNLVDIDTFVKYFIVQTVVMNNDLFRPRAETGQEIGSTFFYKDKGGKISAGPLWDLNWTFAPWAFEGREFLPDTFPYQIHPWFRRFHDDPVFLARYKEIWNNNYQNNILTMTSFVDSMGEKLTNAALENYKRWSPTSNLYSYIWHIDHIKSYFATRAAYLHGEYNKVDILPVVPGPVGQPGTPSKVFGSSATPQTFTLVSFGEMTNLSASFQKGADSAFEITASFNQTSTAEGGYLATISVRPKSSLPAGTHTDVLVLSGTNQGRSFTHNVSLSCVR